MSELREQLAETIGVLRREAKCKVCYGRGFVRANDSGFPENTVFKCEICDGSGFQSYPLEGEALKLESLLRQL